MTEMMIETGIVIDDVDSVLFGISELCNRIITDLEVVKRFIIREKNTKFYLDNNLNSFMQPDQSCTYIWLDTGYTDGKGNPILISLLKCWDGFVGHVVGTINMLCNNVCSYFKLNRNKANKKMDAFKRKYSKKAGQRTIQHIGNEMDYIIATCNEESLSSTLFAKRLAELEFDFTEDESMAVEEEPMAEENDVLDFSITEEQITISLLLEKMEGMQQYMDELVEMLDRLGTESNAQIAELQKKNDEYRKALVQMRTFSQTEYENRQSDEAEDMTAHVLLGEHKKILVIGGQELGVHVMQGIAKTVGFDKKDFDFMDYDKAKSQFDRIRKDGKYRAIIMGACPHKTSGSAGYSSALEMIKQENGMPYAVDARNRAGRLKVTKESFRSALLDVCKDMKLAYAV